MDESTAPAESTIVHTAETVPLSQLHPHPRNYRSHPPDQIAHLIRSVTDHGMYRPIVVARDYTILAGHGLSEVAGRLGIVDVPVVVLDLDPDDPRALKLLVGDNEAGRLAEVDDRGLSELLREISEFSVEELIGTGFDEAMLANLVFVTRPASEIATYDEAAAWVGMPEFASDDDDVLLVLHFDDEASREKLIDEIGVTISKKTRGTWSAWWPQRDKQDLASLHFDAADG